MTDFEKKVTRVVEMIPKGKVATYSSVARMVGCPRAARAVGVVLKNNRSKEIPCHRIVRSDGSLGGYNGLRGVDKLDLLKTEKVSIINGFIDLSTYGIKLK